MARVPTVAELRSLLAQASLETYRNIVDAARDVSVSCQDTDLQRVAREILKLVPDSNAA